MSELPPITMAHMKLRCGCCDDCWEWKAAFRDVKNKRWPVVACRVDMPDGTRKTARYYVRHLMLWVTTGQKPDLGLLRAIVPSCDNPRCVNPAHLKVVTRKAISQAVVKKGVMSTLPRRKKVAEGLRKNAKLSDAAVADIRNSDDGPKVAAAKHGVSTAYVYMLRRGEWRKDYSNPFAALHG